MNKDIYNVIFYAIDKITSDMFLLKKKTKEQYTSNVVYWELILKQKKLLRICQKRKPTLCLYVNFLY